MEFPLAGWILAGGQSRRMGTDKALLRLHAASEPLIVESARRLGRHTRSVTLIGDPAKYGSLGLPVLPDLRPDCGPLAGIETALAASKLEWNAILACDLPAFDETVLAQLAALAGPFHAIVPRQPDGRLQPLCALYHRSALPLITAALDGGTRRVTDALKLLTLRYLQVADSRPFHNLNTPADLHTYRNG